MLSKLAPVAARECNRDFFVQHAPLGRVGPVDIQMEGMSTSFVSMVLTGYLVRYLVRYLMDGANLYLTFAPNDLDLASQIETISVYSAFGYALFECDKADLYVIKMGELSYEVLSVRLK